MKKLYNPNKGAKRIHPSPLPPPPPPPPSSHLSALPTALLALASTLSPEEQEVLAYLLGCGSCSFDKTNNTNNNNNNKSKNKTKKINHPPELGCSCFGCYKSFWARWDSSPNRHVIHAIIDAFEESLDNREMTPKVDDDINTKSRKKKKLKKKKKDEQVVVEEMKIDDAEKADDGYDGFDEFDEGDEILEEEAEKSSVRKFVSWVFGINN